MSTLTKEQAAVVAAQRAGAPVSDLPRLEALVDAAVKRLARDIAARADFAEGQKTVAVSCVNGVITVADDTLMLDTLAHPRGVLYVNGAISKQVANLKALGARRDRSHYWHAVHGRLIHVADVTTGALGAAGGGGGVACTLTCNYQFTLAQMPPRYDEELIAAVAEAAAGGGAARG